MKGCRANLAEEMAIQAFNVVIWDLSKENNILCMITIFLVMVDLIDTRYKKQLQTFRFDCQLIIKVYNLMNSMGFQQIIYNMTQLFPRSFNKSFDTKTISLGSEIRESIHKVRKKYN